MTMMLNPEGVVLTILTDMARSDDLASWFEHIGFDASALASTDQLPAAYVAFHKDQHGCIDVEKALGQLATWPPIASRISELQRQDAAEVAT
jgi:hypothetical protein